MAYTNDQQADDIDKINRIPIVKTILNVICETTGMRFAAIARVTADRWIACSVRDDIEFGVKAGSELKIETTICNEIQMHRDAVVINHVAENESYRNHHTPRIYGFQSYISIPILLQDGSFFGTLCAIDPDPHQLDDEKVIGMFKLFAELISFHLEAQRRLDQEHRAYRELEQLLNQSQDVNNQYRHISNHNLREPLRKMRVFASMITMAAEANDLDKIKSFAGKVESSAENFIGLIDELSDYAAINNNDIPFERVDLNRTISFLAVQLQAEFTEKSISIPVQHLPAIFAIPQQIKRLFSHLFNCIIQLYKSDQQMVIEVRATDASQGQPASMWTGGTTDKWIEVWIARKGTDFKMDQENVLPEFFTTEISMLSGENHQKELAYCRRIVQRHGGKISAYAAGEANIGFCFTLPKWNDGQ